MAKGPKVNPSTMLWFIRSRSYMPIHEIRRRFNIEGEESTVVYDTDGPVYMGLPQKPASVLLELSVQGKIGLECSVEHRSRIVIGVFPMHPAREESTLRPPGQRVPRPPFANGAPPGAPSVFPAMNGQPAGPQPRAFPRLQPPAGPRPAASPPHRQPQAAPNGAAPMPRPAFRPPQAAPSGGNAAAANYPAPRISLNGGHAASDDQG